MKIIQEQGGPHSTMDCILASQLAAPGSILDFGLEMYRQRYCLEIKCRQQRLNNGERTHLVPAGGKLVFQKIIQGH